MTGKKKKILIWSAAVGASVFAVLVAIAAYMLRPAYLERQLVDGLSHHLGLDAAIGDVSVQFFPRPRVSGGDMTLRIPNRPDLPPFISIARFYVDVGLLSALRKHVETVHVDGLKITVPPKDARQAMRDSPPSGLGKPTIIVDHLIAHDAELAFVPKHKDRQPLTFLIHELRVDDLGFDSVMPFYAKLTNPVPRGLVETRGSVGPWIKEDPTSVSLSGDYTFTDADLSTINGIGGTLSSIGKYKGQLTEISATGTTETPNFSLDLGGRPVPLQTTFEAVVNGTNGSTELVRVDGKMRNTSLKVKGVIANLSGPGNRDVNLHVKIEDGRIEDVLALAIDSAEPMLIGDLTLESTFLLPPGKTRVPQRLVMSGRFGLGSAEFSDQQVQDKLHELSRRSQGKDKDEAIGRVLTSLRGRFTVRRGVLTLPDLAFRVPGATVGLAGSYALESGVLDFAGTLRMQASVSSAVGGFKSIFLKPFDPIFRKDGAGAVVPIKVSGTRDAPKMGLEMGRVFGRGKK